MADVSTDTRISGTIDGQQYVDFCTCHHADVDHGGRTGSCDVSGNDNDGMCGCEEYAPKIRVHMARDHQDIHYVENLW